MSAFDPASIERFRRDFETALGRSPAPVERIALAVSGGPDSMAMLALAARAFPGQIIAATVDHALRLASVDEAAMVAAYCDGTGIAHAIVRIAAPPDAGDNIQAWARQERYRLLRRWAVEAGAATLATAHHADDQAETFLMRAARGAGLSGLAAVRARQDIEVTVERVATASSEDRTLALDGQQLCLVRPLLNWRHQELVAIAETLAVPFVDDPSNSDERFDRTRFRRWLTDAPWIDPVQIARAAGNIAEVDADLRAVSQWLWKERAVPSGDFEVAFDVTGVPRAVRRYLARMAIEQVGLMVGTGSGGRSPSASVERLLDSLEAGKAVTQADIMASARRDIWHFRPAPPRRSH